MGVLVYNQGKVTLTCSVPFFGFIHKATKVQNLTFYALFSNFLFFSEILFVAHSFQFK